MYSFVHIIWYIYIYYIISKLYSFSLPLSLSLSLSQQALYMTESYIWISLVFTGSFAASPNHCANSMSDKLSTLAWWFQSKPRTDRSWLEDVAVLDSSLFVFFCWLQLVTTQFSAASPGSNLWKHSNRLWPDSSNTWCSSKQRTPQGIRCLDFLWPLIGVLQKIWYR